MRLKKPMFSSRDSRAPGPTSTEMPAARRRAKPCPATTGWDPRGKQRRDGCRPPRGHRSRGQCGRDGRRAPG
jgi:hypothetical protein